MKTFITYTPIHVAVEEAIASYVEGGSGCVECNEIRWRNEMSEKKMTYIEQSIEIDTPVEKIFQYAADWENWPEFLEGVYDFRPTKETARGPGARYADKAEMLGMKAAVETEIHDFVENRGWRAVATEGMKHQTWWIFEEVDGKTKFTYGLGYRLPIPILSGIMDRQFIKPAWEKTIESSLLNPEQQTE